MEEHALEKERYAKEQEELKAQAEEAKIITNILTNAVKYTPEGKVTLSISGKKMTEDSVQLYVSVQDTGIGIKEEDRERLFESFQRVDETKKPEYLGLLKGHGM